MKSGLSNAPSKLEVAIKPIISGLIIGALVITILFVFFALMMSFNILPLSSANIISSISISVGAFFAGFISAKKLTKNGLLIGLICGFIMFLLFTLIGMAAFKSAPNTASLIRLLLFIISGAIGGIIGVGSADKRKIQY
jgi:putative membrane protein (TIGR04086 family)